jgi:hypothetical protein
MRDLLDGREWAQVAAWAAAEAELGSLGRLAGFDQTTGIVDCCSP